MVGQLGLTFSILALFIALWAAWFTQNAYNNLRDYYEQRERQRREREDRLREEMGLLPDPPEDRDRVRPGWF